MPRERPSRAFASSRRKSSTSCASAGCSATEARKARGRSPGVEATRARGAVSGDSGPRAPGLLRRLASALYDALILAALGLVATFPFLAVFGDSTHGWQRPGLQGWWGLVPGAYSVGCGTRGGHTWRVK